MSRVQVPSLTPSERAPGLRKRRPGARSFPTLPPRSSQCGGQPQGSQRGLNQCLAPRVSRGSPDPSPRPPNGQRPSRAVSRAPPVPHARPAARSRPRRGGHGLLTVVVPLAEQVLQAARGVVVIQIQHQSFLATTACINANRDPSPRAVETPTACAQIDPAGSTCSVAVSSRPRSWISRRNQVSTNAINTIGTADTNTVLSDETNEEITGPRIARGSAAIT